MQEYQNLEYVQSAGEILHDEKYDWRTKKLKNVAVSPHITECSEARKTVVESCGGRLEFAVDAAGVLKLARAWLCHHPLCPICKGRRSMKTFHELKEICAVARRQNPSCQFAMLTLTVPNVPGDDLPATITHLMKSFERLSRRAEVKKVVVGWFRSLEVSYNEKRGDYHPHFHCLLMFKGGYFTSRNYIKQARWLELWQEATRQLEITQVDIRKVTARKKRKSVGADQANADLESAAAEVGKYATKDGDYVQRDSVDDYSANGDVIATLCRAFKNRRLIAYGGLFKSIRSELHLDESEDDLVNIDPNSDDDGFVPVGLRMFLWMGTQRDYVSR